MSAVNKISDIRLLENLVPLNELDHDKLSELAESSSVLRFKRGQSISSATAKNQLVYLLAGTVECSPGSAHAESIEAISQTARQAILTPDKRRRVLAKNDVTVLCVDNDMLDFLRSWGNSAGFEVDEIDASDSSGLADGLMQSEVLLNLSPSGIQALMSAIVPVEFASNEIIFNQGDKPDYYYIVSRGHCSITRHAAEMNAPVELAILNPGDTFGEEALIANTARGATARMTDDGLVLRLGMEDFKKILESPFVKPIGIEKAEKLKLGGAVVLDLRPAELFARDGSGTNIPFAELRSRIGELNKDKEYIVVSDDNKMSAVAAFLLSQKRFNVYLLKTAAKEEIAAKAAKVSAETKALHLKNSELQHQLEQANINLQKEEQRHAETKGHVQLLEDKLVETKGSAKSAIIEASNLKKKSETSLQKRIHELNEELEKEKQNSQSLINQNDSLNSQLEVANNEIQQAHQKIETDLIDVSEIKKLEAEFNQTISHLKTEIEELQQSHEKVIKEKEALSNSLDELNRITNESNDTHSELQCQLQSAIDRSEKTEHELKQLQEQYAELESNLKINQDDKQSLNTQLAVANQNVEQLTHDINQLQNQMSNSGSQTEKVEQELQALQQKQSGLESINEQVLEQNELLNDQLNEEKQKSILHATELDELKSLLKEAVEQAEKSEQELQALQQKQPEFESINEQVLEQNELLNDQLNEEKQKSILHVGELDELNSLLKEAVEKAEKSEQELQALQQKQSGLESGNEQVLEQNELLNDQLNEEKQRSVLYLSDINELKSLLREAVERAEKSEQDLQVLQQKQLDIEARHEQALEEKQLLTDQLDEAKQKSSSHADELNNLQSQLHISDEKTEKSGYEMQALQDKHSELELTYKQLQKENDSLNEQVDESRQKCKQQADELSELQSKLQTFIEQDEKNEIGLKSTQNKFSVLESNYEQAQAENVSLNEQLNEVRQKSDQQSNEISDLHNKLRGTTETADKADQALEESQQQLEELASRFEQSQAAYQQLQRELRDLVEVKQGLEEKISAFDQAPKIQEQSIRQESNSIKEQLQSMRSILVEKKSQFVENEAGYQELIEQLSTNLNKVTAESKQLTADNSKEKLRNKILIEELSRLQDENMRSGTKVKFLLFVLLFLVAIVGASYYLGIDLHDQTTVLIEEVVPQINELIDSIPQSGSL